MCAIVANSEKVNSLHNFANLKSEIDLYFVLLRNFANLLEMELHLVPLHNSEKLKSEIDLYFVLLRSAQFRQFNMKLTRTFISSNVQLICTITCAIEYHNRMRNRIAQ